MRALGHTAHTPQSQNPKVTLDHLAPSHASVTPAAHIMCKTAKKSVDLLATGRQCAMLTASGTMHLRRQGGIHKNKSCPKMHNAIQYYVFEDTFRELVSRDCNRLYSERDQFPECILENMTLSGVRQVLGQVNEDHGSRKAALRRGAKLHQEPKMFTVRNNECWVLSAVGSLTHMGAHKLYMAPGRQRGGKCHHHLRRTGGSSQKPECAQELRFAPNGSYQGRFEVLAKQTKITAKLQRCGANFEKDIQMCANAGAQSKLRSKTFCIKNRSQQL